MKKVCSKGVDMELSSRKDLNWPEERRVGSLMVICSASKASHLNKSFAHPPTPHHLQKEKRPDNSKP